MYNTSSLTSSEIITNYHKVCDRIKVAAESVDRDYNEICLVVVTKTFDPSVFIPLIDAGHKNFGENKRDKLMKILNAKGIETRPMMAGTLPDQPGLRNCNGIIVGDLKNSRYVRDNTLFVGVHPTLDIQDMDYVLEAMNDFLARNK